MDTSPTNIQALLIGTHEVALMLDVPRSTFQKMCARDEAPKPYYRIGGKLKWKPADVESWLETKKVAA